MWRQWANPVRRQTALAVGRLWLHTDELSTRNQTMCGRGATWGAILNITCVFLQFYIVPFKTDSNMPTVGHAQNWLCEPGSIRGERRVLRARADAQPTSRRSVGLPAHGPVLRVPRRHVPCSRCSGYSRIIRRLPSLISVNEEGRQQQQTAPAARALTSRLQHTR